MKFDPKEIPYFDADKLPRAESSYVAWIDVMGVRPAMSRSIMLAANFIYKFHVAVMESKTEDIELYPVMDGVYVVSRNQEPLRIILNNVFSKVAKIFIDKKDNQYRFLIKGSVSYGPIINGKDVPNSCSMILKSNDAYKNSLLLGNPMIQSLSYERYAPPFGVYIHESARGFSPIKEYPFTKVWWSWWIKPECKTLAKRLYADLNNYYDWCKKRADAIEYPQDRIDAHKKMIDEYFIDL